MNSENKTWESVKQNYLDQVEASLKAAGQQQMREIIRDVDSHLGQKYAELKPDERTWENFQKIITEMGPASDYVELLGEKTVVISGEAGIWKRLAVNGALSIVIIATIILLCQIADRLIMPYYGRSVVTGEPNKPGEFAVRTVETLQGRYIDNIKYPFVDDPDVIGKWVGVDFVQNPEDFTPGQKRWQWDLWFKGIEFYKGGTTSWCSGQWTKSLVMNPYSRTASRYTIKTIDGTRYMFYEWKSGDYTILHRKPAYYVLKKEPVVNGQPNIDIKSSAFDIHLEPKRGVCNLVVSIQNPGEAVIPKFKLKFYQGDPNNNVDEAGNIHNGWHEAGPIEPGKSWNECTGDFHLPDGQYEFNVVLDYDNAIPEINESNNKASLKVQVLNGQIQKENI